MDPGEKLAKQRDCLKNWQSSTLIMQTLTCRLVGVLALPEPSIRENLAKCPIERVNLAKCPIYNSERSELSELSIVSERTVRTVSSE
jgi:hypothetical protein